MTPPVGDLGQLVDHARRLDKHAVATLIGMFEDTRPAAASRRQAILDALDPPSGRRSVVLGVTGTPGSGKSSIVARLVPQLLRLDETMSIAVLAIDPSSQISRGALLGDRTRMRFATDERRAFIRSQATATELGGLAPTSFQVCRLLTALFDTVIVETVGIGQSELDIRHLADHVCLVLQPLGGDEIQYLKAGIVEIPDTFVLNKNDEPSADRTYHQLYASLSLARPFDTDHPPIHRVSARTGAGLDELTGAMLGVLRNVTTRSTSEREQYFFQRWVREEWGRVGSRFLASHDGGAARLSADHDGYDARQAAFNEALARSVARK